MAKKTTRKKKPKYQDGGLLGLVSGFLKGDETSRKVLSDEFEAHGDLETAEILRSEGVQTMTFDEEEARGSIGIGRGIYGPFFKLTHLKSHNSDEIAAIYDLYENSPIGQDNESGKEQDRSVFVFYDLHRDDVAAKLIYNNDGSLTVIINNEMEVYSIHHENGIHSDYDYVAVFPAIPAHNTGQV